MVFRHLNTQQLDIASPLRRPRAATHLVGPCPGTRLAAAPGLSQAARLGAVKRKHRYIRNDSGAVIRTQSYRVARAHDPTADEGPHEAQQIAAEEHALLPRAQEEVHAGLVRVVHL